MRHALAVFVVCVLVALPAHAHNGRIMLFADTTASDCNVDLSTGNITNISLLYIPGDGPDEIAACDFKLDYPSSGVTLGSVTWPPSAFTIGALETGITVSFGGCLGPDDPIWLGTIQVINMSQAGTFLFSIVDHPTTTIPGVYAYGCAPDFLQREALGGAFVFNGECELDNLWHVKSDGTGEALTLQAGINAAFEGDTVLAAPGTYLGTGNREIDFRGKGILVIAESEYDAGVVSPSTIDLATGYRAFDFDSGEDSSSVLCGFSILYSDVSITSTPAISCSNSSPTIKLNTIDVERDPAITINSSSVIFEDNSITSYSMAGTAIDCDDSSPTFRDNSIIIYGAPDSLANAFDFNNCTQVSIDGNDITVLGENFNGRAITLSNTTQAVIEDNGITTSAFGGPAIYATESEVTIRNNHIYDCYSPSYVVYCSNTTVLMDNNNIHGCNDPFSFGPVFITGSPLCVIRNNWIYQNEGQFIVRLISIGPASILDNNTLFMNRGTYTIIRCESSNPLLTNNTIANNVVANGPGCYFDSSSIPILTGNIIYNTNTPPWFGGIYARNPAISISCCNVYANTGGNYQEITDPTGTDGNISEDPLFCEPSGGIFSLKSYSPCLPEIHPDGNDCGLIGAAGWGCASDNPYLYILDDVANDQGRQVSLTWKKSTYDTTGSATSIYNYEVYRRIDDLPSPPAAFTSDPDNPGTHSEERELLAYPEGDWHFLMEVPAHCEEIYSTVVPTLEDSCVYNDSTVTGEPLYYSMFFIRAATAVPGTYFDSHPDSAYSVDNLSPSTPVGVAMTNGAVLQWDDNEEKDLSGYRVYGKTSESGDAILLETLSTSEYDVTDSNENGGYHFWGVSAFDYNGNESRIEEIAWITTDVAEHEVPTVNHLSQNYPNPFNPITTIDFGLKSPADVSLRIYDVSGRLVRVLADGYFGAGEYCRIWDGRTASGAMSASGVYFYKLVTGDFTEMKKMILLR